MANILYLVANELAHPSGSQKKTASASSMPYYGYHAVVNNGGYSPLLWTIGPRCLNAFSDAAGGMYGKVCIRVTDGQLADLKNIFIGSAIARVHACAAGTAGSKAKAEALE